MTSKSMRPIGKIFKWYDLADPPSAAGAGHPLTPEERSAASKKAWDSRGRGRTGTLKPPAGVGAPAAPPHAKPTYPPDQPLDAKTGRPIPIKVQSIDEAVTAVLAGKVVELPQVAEVSTLIEKLAAIANEAKAKGQAAPNYDLCRVTVANTNLFCTSGLKTKQYPNGVPRVKMPQMAGKPVPGTPAAALPVNKDGEVNGADAFIAHMKNLGISVSKITPVPAASLKASQAELVGTNVAGMLTNKNFDPGKDPIFVSRDGYVIDGHHRWAAVVGRDAADGHLGDSTMNVIRVDAPISEVLQLANHWSRKFGIQSKAAGAAGIKK